MFSFFSGLHFHKVTTCLLSKCWKILVCTDNNKCLLDLEAGKRNDCYIKFTKSKYFVSANLQVFLNVDSFRFIKNTSKTAYILVSQHKVLSTRKILQKIACIHLLRSYILQLWLLSKRAFPDWQFFHTLHIW